ncbi:ribonuclease HI [Sphingomonas psychrotolerans]|uniref:Ribonuclease HI n=1 Tax=Sphingomonas psychrotolerans TaxID=1327635 RepID=A0A2K8MIP5_9SPHN|nr:reverse transcriptase-like protein [Sphingomonas psychrotolerans]ATY33733.1 ribonuclease HI [Sphingomonas psychrotolerans]
MPSRLKIFFDGGCRPNPGAIEIAVVAGGRTTILRDLGNGTSSDAEWLALIQALTIARSLDAADFVLIGDTADVVAKANGTVKCRGVDIRHLERFRALASAAGRPRVRHIKRSQNLAGIALARLRRR